MSSCNPLYLLLKLMLTYMLDVGCLIIISTAPRPNTSSRVPHVSTLAHLHSAGLTLDRGRSLWAMGFDIGHDQPEVCFLLHLETHSQTWVVMLREARLSRVSRPQYNGNVTATHCNGGTRS